MVAKNHHRGVVFGDGIKRTLASVSYTHLDVYKRQVVSHAKCPVVVVRADSSVNESTKYGPVVVGVDGSDVSQQATEYAFARASARGAELVAVHLSLVHI